MRYLKANAEIKSLKNQLRIEEIFFYNRCFFRRYHATLKLEGNDEGLYSHLSTSKLHSENILAVKLGLSEL